MGKKHPIPGRTTRSESEARLAYRRSAKHELLLRPDDIAKSRDFVERNAWKV